MRSTTLRRLEFPLGLSNSNLTVLNGAEGLSQMAVGLVAQGKAIFDALRGDVMDYDEEEAAAPLVPNSEPSQHRR